MPYEQPGLSINDFTAPPAAHSAASIYAVYDYDIFCTQPQHLSVNRISTSTTCAVSLRRPSLPLRRTSQQTLPHFATSTTSFSASSHTLSTTHSKTIHPPSRYTGKERDTESGNDYMFARYYNSATGRFLSPDWSVKVEPVPYAKLDTPQTLNLYAYVSNNPLSKIDPDGHLEAEWHMAITFLAGMKTGHGVIGSAKLAMHTTAVDSRGGLSVSQGTDAAHANWHAMEGRQSNGQLQDARAARQGTHDVVSNAMKSGDAPLALHAVQDLATPLHDGHAWSGSYFSMDFAKHFVGDNLPSPTTMSNACKNSVQVLEGQNPVQVPGPAPITPLPPAVNTNVSIGSFLGMVGAH